MLDMHPFHRSNASKQCRKCGLIKLARQFPHGMTERPETCVSCHKISRNVRRAKLPPTRQTTAAGRAKILVNGARDRARKSNLPFDLDDHISELQARLDAGHCEMSGIPFTFDRGRRFFDSPSLDRVVPEKGYVYSNVRVICWSLNAGLGDWGEDMFRQVASGWMEQHAKLAR